LAYVFSTQISICRELFVTLSLGILGGEGPWFDLSWADIADLADISR
jgi:hypothetical protein